MFPGLSSLYLYLPTFTYFHAFLFRPIWWSSGHSSFKTVLIWTGHGYLTVHCVYSNHPEQWHHRRRHHQGKWTVFESFLNVLVWHREMLRVLFRQICVYMYTRNPVWFKEFYATLCNLMFRLCSVNLKKILSTYYMYFTYRRKYVDVSKNSLVTFCYLLSI